MSLFSHDDQHEPPLASLSSTIIYFPGGNPLLSSEETQSTLLILLGDYLNILRTKKIETAMFLERSMVKLDTEKYHIKWREKMIKTYRLFNPNFPEIFKIKVFDWLIKHFSLLPRVEFRSHGHRENVTHFNSFLYRFGGPMADRRKEAA